MREVKVATPDIAHVRYSIIIRFLSNYTRSKFFLLKMNYLLLQLAILVPTYKYAARSYPFVSKPRIGRTWIISCNFLQDRSRKIVFLANLRDENSGTDALLTRNNFQIATEHTHVDHKFSPTCYWFNWGLNIYPSNEVDCLKYLLVLHFRNPLTHLHQLKPLKN